MNLDLLVLALVLFFAVLGAMAGGLMQISHIAALVAGGFLAKPLGTRVGPAVAEHFKAPEIVGVLGVTVFGFFAVYAVVQVVLRMFIKRVIQNQVLGGMDRILGFGLGAAKSALILYVLLSALIFFERPFTSITHYQFDTRGSKVADLVREENLFTRFSFPGTRGLTAVARAATNPSAAADDPDLAALAHDPKVAEVLKTGELQRALQNGDAVALLRSNRVMAVLTDPKLQDRLERAADHVPPPRGKR